MTLISVDCSKQRCYAVVAKLADDQSVRVLDYQKYAGDLVSFCVCGDKIEKFDGVNLTKTPDTDKQELTQDGCDCDTSWSLPMSLVHIDVARELEMRLNVERAKNAKRFELTAAECQRILSNLDDRSQDIVVQGLIMKIRHHIGLTHTPTFGDYCTRCEDGHFVIAIGGEPREFHGTCTRFGFDVSEFHGCQYFKLHHEIDKQERKLDHA